VGRGAAGRDDGAELPPVARLRPAGRPVPDPRRGPAERPRHPGLHPYAYATNNPTTLTDPSGHDALALPNPGGDLAQILAFFAALRVVAAQEVGGGPGRALRWAGYAFLGLAALLTCLQLPICRENGGAVGGAAQEAVGTAVGAAAGVGESAVEVGEAFWEAVREHLKKTKTATDPDEEPEPRPTPPPPPPDDDNGTCLTARENQYLMPEREDHIRQYHGPQASRRSGKGVFDATFFRDLDNHIYDVLYGYTELYDPPGSGVSECLFEADLGYTIGRDPDNQPTRTMAVAIRRSGYIVTAFPCYDPPIGCNLMRDQ
jgi:hypothetical protein